MSRRKPKHEEHENLDRWLVSYADFITLLFAFFVVMYSISSVNEGKYRVLSDSIIAAFRTPQRSTKPISLSPKAKSVMLNEGAPIRAPLIQIPHAPGAQMQHIASELRDALRPLINQKLIKVSSNKLWVEVEMNTRILFPSGSAVLESTATPVLRALAGVLNKLPNPVQVEGYTDNVPISTLVYPSNWELSTARASSVVRLFARAGVDPGHMAAIGYGEYRPLASNETAAGRNRNRRVVVVILANKKARHVLETGQGVAPGDNALTAGPLRTPSQPVVATPGVAGRRTTP